MSDVEVAIVGAGPYGISVAAHLAASAVEFRIFGKPMHRWRCQMPQGMFLKSDGFASSLSDPTGRFTLQAYCSEHSLPFGQRAKPVSLATFTEYALAFQSKLAPAVEETMVSRIEQKNEAFQLTLSSGATVVVSKVILATGLDHSTHVPPQLAGLPRELFSHSADHHAFHRFAGREVIVIGAGQSALETAALLSEHGVAVRLIARGPSIAWNGSPRMAPRSLYERVRHPKSGLGDGLGLWFYCAAPMLFRRLPERVRFEKAQTVLGPAGAWWLKSRVEGQIDVMANHRLESAEARRGRAVLHTLGPDGSTRELCADHVIAATGYRFDIARLPFLGEDVKSQIRTVAGYPVLSSTFESSIRGIYFTGLASAPCFGPSMRFLYGTHYTARCIASAVAETRSAPAPRCRV